MGSMAANMLLHKLVYGAKAERVGTKHVDTACEQHVRGQ